MKVVNRIKASEEFALTVKKGQASHCESFTMHVRNNELGYSRIGISISSKLGNAVVRNRCKRQVRAMCDSIVDYKNKTLDIVIVIRKPFLQKTFDDNFSSLKNLFEQQEGFIR